MYRHGGIGRFASEGGVVGQRGCEKTDKITRSFRNSLSRWRRRLHARSNSCGQSEKKRGVLRKRS